ncbi:hypothetical protein EV356DRAFT_506234 [Viridothelium virens]|uniref:Secreted protein n=1 Tax=Viridothelium virens TaxID=1048519 RepID=A0A6A6H1S7_VIRVR|nr:hypothetical protein EV356DRAFT_506234 [Viridothelium virens]
MRPRFWAFANPLSVALLWVNHGLGSTAKRRELKRGQQLQAVPDDMCRSIVSQSAR